VLRARDSLVSFSRDFCCALDLFAIHVQINREAPGN
jgi:hypothetical protein